jgi:pimeloyl-ACP methyl ester carboxylesterase
MVHTCGVITRVEVRDGVRLATSDTGSGPTVVLLHGWPVTSLHWRHTVPALAAAGLRALTADLRGLGASTDSTGQFAKAALADDVIALADHFGIERFAVVGHDWGGTVGYLLAADHPDRVRALVVEEEVLPGIDVPVPEPGRSHYPDWHGPFNRQPGLAESVLPGREDAYHRAFLRQSAGPWPLSEPAQQAYLDAYRQPTVLTAGLGYYRTAREDAQAVADRSATPLATPVLTIGGQYGMGTAVHQCLSRLATDTRHLQIPEAGHYPAEQNPDLVNPGLLEFLTQHLTGE